MNARAGNMSLNNGIPFGGDMSNISFGSGGWGSASESNMSDYDLQRSHWVGQKLTQKLGPEYISTRSGGGGKLSYIEGWKVINIANEVFNHDGWSSSVVSLQQDYCDQLDPQGQRFNVGFSAIVRITLRSGAYHEDVGFGQMDNARGKGMAFDKCKKEAITDGLKRALRYFGNLTGNCVYDKNYTSEISKIKVQPVRLDAEALHRHPDVDPNKSATPATGPSIPTSVLKPASRTNNHPPQAQARPQHPSTSGHAGPSRTTTVPRPPMLPPQQQQPSASAPHQQRPPVSAPSVLKKPVAAATGTNDSFTLSDDGMDDQMNAFMDQFEADRGPPIHFDGDMTNTSVDILESDAFQPAGHSTVVMGSGAFKRTSSVSTTKSSPPNSAAATAPSRGPVDKEASAKRMAEIMKVMEMGRAPAEEPAGAPQQPQFSRAKAIPGPLTPSQYIRDRPAVARVHQADPSGMGTAAFSSRRPTSTNSPGIGGGGFNLPAGMTLESSQKMRVPIPAIGQKRSADGNYKQVDGSSRPILGQLHVEHDGAVKRPRY